jgi:hypothetical protein
MMRGSAGPFTREDTMSKRVKLPPDAKPGTNPKIGKGWRLVNPKKTRTLKAALVTTYGSGKDRFAIFRLNR